MSFSLISLGFFGDVSYNSEKTQSWQMGPRGEGWCWSVFVKGCETACRKTGVVQKDQECAEGNEELLCSFPSMTEGAVSPDWGLAEVRGAFRGSP